MDLKQISNLYVSLLETGLLKKLIEIAFLNYLTRPTAKHVVAPQMPS